MIDPERGLRYLSCVKLNANSRTVKNKKLLNLIWLVLTLIVLCYTLIGTSDNEYRGDDAPMSSDEGVCIRVSDGDTVIVKMGGRSEKIRLNGIDAPELKQKHGKEARRYLANRILKRKVRVKGNSRDKYKRLLATIYLDEENINLSMIREGWAWDYVQFSMGREYAQAQKEARAARRGLWVSSNAIPPWQFRHPEAHGMTERVAEDLGRSDAANARYWISRSGKTHNRDCKQFLGNSGSGTYSNTPGPIDAKCCGGANR